MRYETNMSNNGINWQMWEAIGTVGAVVLALTFSILRWIKQYFEPKTNLYFSNFSFSKELDQSKKRDKLIVTFDVENKKRKYRKTEDAINVDGQIMISDEKHILEFSYPLSVAKYILVGKKITKKYDRLYVEGLIKNKMNKVLFIFTDQHKIYKIEKKMPKTWGF